MEYRDTAEEAAFRARLRAWIAAHTPVELPEIVPNEVPAGRRATNWKQGEVIQTVIGRALSSSNGSADRHPSGCSTNTKSRA